MIKMIGRDEFLKLQKDSEKNVVIVDVLDEDHFRQGHIRGAINMPLERIGRIAKKALSKDDLIIVYCASMECQASTLAAQKLQALGFKNVFDYKGGLKDYKEAGLALESSFSRSGSCCCCS